MAHEFNNLLTAILGYSEMAVLNTPPDSGLTSYLREIQKAAGRASSLTNQLLAFSRRQIIEPKVVNLNDLILNTSGMIRPREKPRNCGGW